jgi:glucosamine--fructose-6-phosphate aminotransferase (isomerizing)
VTRPTHQLIEGRYLQDILGQPRVMTDTLNYLRTRQDLSTIKATFRSAPIERIVLTGMGASLSALYSLQLMLNAHGHTALTVETSELIHYMSGVLTSTSLIVVVSQSGRSAEIVRLLDQNAGKAGIIGITNTENSPLALQADVTILTRAGEEFSVSSKTYVTALLALEVFGASWCGDDLQQAFADLSTAPVVAQRYLSYWRDHVAALADKLADVRYLFLVGRGRSLSAVGTGALIAKESTRFHVEGMSSAAFRHGPMEMLGPDVMVLVFEGDLPTRDLNRKLITDVRDRSGRAELIGPGATIPALQITSGPSHIAPVLEILPVQMLTLALAANVGLEPGRFEYATKITTEE